MLNVLHQIECVMNRGKSVLRDQMEGWDMGDPRDFESFEEFYQAYLTCVTRMIDLVIDSRRNNYKYVQLIAPDAFMSCFVDDCIEKGLEMNDGGARYKYGHLSLGGLSDAVDCLAAVKKFVYDDKLITMDELITACRTNYEGRETLRQQLINWAPKFGNDDPYVDDIAVRLLDDVICHMTKRNEEECDNLVKFYPIIGTFERAGEFGAMTGATPDGRKAEEAVCNNYSPSTGVDLNGPTAAIKSITKPDLRPYFAGCPMDMHINPNETEGDIGIQKLINLIKSYQDLGGNMLTITGVSTETLIDAKAHPENHRGLRVRLGGLSAYFVALPPGYQDFLIERTKYSL